MRFIPIIRFVFLSFIGIFISEGEAFSQRLDLDSVFVLPSVQIVANKVQHDNNVGSRRSTINATVLESNQTQSLSELLSENSLIFIKSLGQGGLSTSSFRGTSSNHTQVNWNGININPVMGGSFDFAQFPTFFTDEVTLFHGNTYLKNGTGALGGSINLNNRPNWDRKGLQGRLLGESGSNNTYTGGLDLGFVSNKLTSNTRLFYQQSDNNFKYLNKVLQKDPFYERRKDAEYWQGGFMQEFYYKLSEKNQFSTNLWYQYNKNRLPQPILVNKKQHETQVNNSWRYFLGYSGYSEKHEYKASFAYLRDNMKYTNASDEGYVGIKSLNVSNSAITKGDYMYRWNDNFNIGASLNYRYDWIDSNNYDELISRNTMTVQVNTELTLLQRLVLNLQLMGELNDHLFMPTFSAGVDYRLVEDLLNVKGSVAYNYHYPTLNDLFWIPGGNPNLNPEKGFQYDVTVSLRPEIGKVKFKFDLSYYIMNIDDWIAWLPTEQTYIWSPRNIQRVLSHGAELFSEISYFSGNWKNRLIFNYGYSPSINKTKVYDKDATYNKQLPYIPIHKWNVRYMGSWKSLSFTYSVAYTDKRYTSTDSEYSTNSFTIHDADLGYTFKLGDHYKLSLKMRVNNLFNAYYESTQFYPMPLRSYYGSLLLAF